MRNYEIVLILHSELDETAFNAALEKVKGWITTSGGTASTGNNGFNAGAVTVTAGDVTVGAITASGSAARKCVSKSHTRVASGRRPVISELRDGLHNACWQ